MGHLYHGYVSHNQRVPVFFHITKLLGICHLRLKESQFIIHKNHPFSMKKSRFTSITNRREVVFERLYMVYAINI
jgi:hypothetical protein